MGAPASLLCHPLTPAPWVRALCAEANWLSDEGIRLSYRLQADTRLLALPGPQPRKPTDDLWRRTCFEAFLLGAEAPGYREVNLSPSGAWAGYGFSGYRQPIRLPALADPAIQVDRDGDGIRVEAAVDASWIPKGPVLRIGLSAVVEELGGSLSYWALAHPSSRPDFHHPDGLLLELAR